MNEQEENELEMLITEAIKNGYRAGVSTYETKNTIMGYIKKTLGMNNVENLITEKLNESNKSNQNKMG